MRGAATFSFHGTLPGSKSLFIRALISRSYGDELAVEGVSDSEDVDRVRRGLESLRRGGEIDCGDGGAVLRFLALRASRMPGEHVLTGSDRLFSRPISELRHVLEALGAETELNGRRLRIRSPGWQPGTVSVDCRRSSQFASAVLANCWELSEPLTIELQNMGVSTGYWRLTLRLVRQLGMSCFRRGDGYRVAAGQSVDVSHYQVEMDMGCAFAISAVAAVSGEARLTGFSPNSHQPDARFPELLRKLGVPVEDGSGELRISQAPRMQGVRVDLGSSPDLFPVLAVLAGLAVGESLLTGAPQLRYKESDRIAKTAELLEQMGRPVETREDGVHILAGSKRRRRPFVFNADRDHRMAMAAAVARQSGFPVRIVGGESVDKSFKGFWTILGWQP